MFSSKSFIVPGLTFRSLIHFEFTYVYGVRECSNFILLHVAVQFSQHHLLKRLSILHCIFLPPFLSILIFFTLIIILSNNYITYISRNYTLVIYDIVLVFRQYIGSVLEQRDITQSKKFQVRYTSRKKRKRERIMKRMRQNVNNPWIGITGTQVLLMQDVLRIWNFIQRKSYSQSVNQLWLTLKFWAWIPERWGVSPRMPEENKKEWKGKIDSNCEQVIFEVWHFLNIIPRQQLYLHIWKKDGGRKPDALSLLRRR